MANRRDALKSLGVGALFIGAQSGATGVANAAPWQKGLEDRRIRMVAGQDGIQKRPIVQIRLALSLDVGLFAAGEGEARFRDFKYRVHSVGA